LRFLASRPHAHRLAIGSPVAATGLRPSGPAPGPDPPAHRDPYAHLAGGFRIGVVIVYGYIHEAIDLFAALVPALTEAVRLARTKAYLILNGTLIDIDRVAADRSCQSGRHKRHGDRAGPDRSGRSARLGLARPARCSP